jgi:hypothetical protein
MKSGIYIIFLLLHIELLFDDLVELWWHVNIPLITFSMDNFKYEIPIFLRFVIDLLI